MENQQIVAVKWHRPGSQFYGVVHFVSKALVQMTTDPPGRDTVVLWPRKGKPAERWEGVLVDAAEGNWASVGTTTVTIVSRLACFVQQRVGRLSI